MGVQAGWSLRSRSKAVSEYGINEANSTIFGGFW